MLPFYASRLSVVELATLHFPSSCTVCTTKGCIDLEHNAKGANTDARPIRNALEGVGRKEERRFILWRQWVTYHREKRQRHQTLPLTFKSEVARK
jgi:hypothetical protein